MDVRCSTAAEDQRGICPGPQRDLVGGSGFDPGLLLLFCGVAGGCLYQGAGGKAGGTAAAARQGDTDHEMDRTADAGVNLDLLVPDVFCIREGVGT